MERCTPVVPSLHRVSLAKCSAFSPGHVALQRMDTRSQLECLKQCRELLAKVREHMQQLQGNARFKFPANCDLLRRPCSIQNKRKTGVTVCAQMPTIAPHLAVPDQPLAFHKQPVGNTSTALACSCLMNASLFAHHVQAQSSAHVPNALHPNRASLHTGRPGAVLPRGHAQR